MRIAPLIAGLFIALLPHDSTAAVLRRTLLTPYAAISATAAGIPVLFLDADATLRPALRPGAPVNRPEDVVLEPYVAAKIAEYNAKGFFVAIVSNQAGIPKFATLESVDAGLQRTVELIGIGGGVVHMYDFAENYDGDRKPGTGMFERVDQFLTATYGQGVDKARSFMVGDAGWAQASKGNPADVRPDGSDGFSHSNTDRLAAENYGIRFVEAAQFFEWVKRLGERAIDDLADLRRVWAAHPELVPPANQCGPLLTSAAP
jgi:HAD superfamily hydrolase (TIGR01662 family)